MYLISSSPVVAITIRPNSLSASYSYAFDDNIPFEEENSLPLPPRGLTPGGYSDALVAHYFHEVADKQWLLVDRSILPDIIYEALNGNQGFEGFACEAARLLASIHKQRAARGNIPSLLETSIQNKYNRLRDIVSRKYEYTVDDAWAALIVISSFLFDGGKGDWLMWLHVVCSYTQVLFSRFPSPQHALMLCTPRERHSIKAALWFDVLAAITTQQRPILLTYIRELFNPSASGVHDVSNPLQLPDELSMLSIMGCESRVLWALAETATLATWKAEQLELGALSIPDLVKRSQDIEKCLQIPITPLPPYADDTQIKRHYCSEMFRTSTMLFLRSVVSGDHPNVQEISDGVLDIFRVMHDMGRYPAIKTSVVRMTVFSLFICGSLTDSRELRRTVLDLLDGEGAVGNCSTIPRLLNRVWDSRSTGRNSDPCQWRNTLTSEKMLLV